MKGAAKKAGKFYLRFNNEFSIEHLASEWEGIMDIKQILKGLLNFFSLKCSSHCRVMNFPSINDTHRDDIMNSKQGW